MFSAFAQGKILQAGPTGGVPQSALAPPPPEPRCLPLAMNARCISALTTLPRWNAWTRFTPAKCSPRIFMKNT